MRAEELQMTQDAQRKILRESRSFQRLRLVEMFGMVTGPIVKMLESDAPTNADEFTDAFEDFKRELNNWNKQISKFAGKFAARREEVEMSTRAMEKQLRALEKLYFSMREHPEEERNVLNFIDHVERFESLREDVLRAINRIPTDIPPCSLPARSTFTGYLLLHAEFTNARERVILFDRYLDESFIHLYLSTARRNATVRLVTVDDGNKHGIRAVAEISKKAAVEFDDYELRKVDKKDHHDRLLLIDDRVYDMQQSFKDFAKAPTRFGHAEIEQSDKTFEDLLVNSTLVHSTQSCRN